MRREHTRQETNPQEIETTPYVTVNSASPADKKAKQLLAESELKYRTVVEKSLQGIVIALAAPLRLVFANANLAGMLGYSVEELLSLSPEGITALISQEDRAIFFGRMERRFQGEPAETSLEFRAVRKDGTIVWLEVFSNLIEYKGQPAVLGMFLDISERKKTEQALRASEERYRELANSVPELVFEADLTGKITFMSQRAFDFTGFTNEELEGRNLLEFLVPEDRERAIMNIKKVFANEKRDNNEYTLFKKNGTTYPALVRASRIISENKVIGLRGLVIEITERKKAEKALQESEIHYRLLSEREHLINEKLNVVGKLTRHDVRNKLMVVKANSYLLKKKIGDDAKTAKYIAEIDHSVEQAESLLEFSRIYEKIGTEQLKSMKVEECFNEAVSLFPNLQNVKVINECRGLTVTADSLLTQLFYNLIDNTLKHGEKVSQIRLHYKREGNGAKMFYTDNGIGISATNKTKLFSEGFTTGGGTGYGLYLAKRMMEVYGWTIKEEGEEGKGVEFVISIPDIS
jgi:PAS domain S-box-containing protein